jgi:hypothetical protein
MVASIRRRRHHLAVPATLKGYQQILRGNWLDHPVAVRTIGSCRSWPTEIDAPGIPAASVRANRDR